MSEKKSVRGKETPGSGSTVSPGDVAVGRAGAVHDINQMLGVITGRAELLMHREAAGPFQEDLQAIALAAHDAAAMLRRYHRGIPHEARDGQEAAVNLHSAAEAVALLIRPAAGRRWTEPADGPTETGWVFERDVPQHLFTSVPGQVVREVLSNLLVNALEVLPDGGHILLDAMADPERVILTVADDGPGLDKETARRIFEPGFTTHEGEFRGIGLAGSRQLLKCFDGRLNISPHRGPGAMFMLDLPRVQPPPEKDTPKEPIGGDRLQVAGLRVLVVDDEPSVRDMLGDVLAELKCEVACAGNAAKAIEIFKPGGFDLAIIDQTLPGATGLNLASDLRERDARLVVALISGWGQEEVLAGADPAVVDMVATKPLEWKRITEILDKAAGLVIQRKHQKG